MQTFDLTPLYRTSIGFDRLAQMLDTINMDVPTGYPPYNIEKLTDNKYCITMAVSGFDEANLNIDVKENILSVTGDSSKDDNREYLYKGISSRNFERRFRLADYVEVESANLSNGLLNIILVRELPEAMKPRKIEISTSKVIEG
ncbi:MAG: Hsp20 family protein [Proteobacteria bacterium]|nr:Hsp20 family protein [Hyphomicrobiales bacterium]MBL6770476.1 Hsp20 family protein [Hyphomicrobiales bacterium]MDA0939246.1 Hsp20 family protein [Pseudomonadota bacterium]